VIDQPRGKEIRVIADDLSAHKDFLAVHREVHLHFTPTYSSWLDQVELWFSKIERDVIARGCLHFRLGSEVEALAIHPSDYISTQSVGTGH
jgi:transposase